VGYLTFVPAVPGIVFITPFALIGILFVESRWWTHQCLGIKSVLQVQAGLGLSSHKNSIPVDFALFVLVKINTKHGWGRLSLGCAWGSGKIFLCQLSQMYLLCGMICSSLIHIDKGYGSFICSCPITEIDLAGALFSDWRSNTP